MKATSALLYLAPLLLAACDAPAGEDPAYIRARYKGLYVGPCNTWVTSPNTGTVYCSSPTLGFSTDAAYAAAAAKVATTGPDPFADFDKKSADEKKTLLMAEGEKVYGTQCAACHQKEGTGVAPTFPPLANDPVANGGPVEEHITVVLKGLSGKVINGVAYSGAMTPFANLSDNEIAAVITFERNSWGNNGGVVEPAQVAALRK